MKRSCTTKVCSPHGVILVEACASIMLIGLVLAMVSLLLTRYASSTDYFLNYRRAQLAATSCVERMRAGILEVADDEFTDDAGIACTIRVDDVDDKVDSSWQPLSLVHVTTSVMGKHGRVAHYGVRTYLQCPQKLGGTDQ